MLNIKKKKIYFLFGIFIFGFLNFLSIRALVAPQVYFTQLNLPKDSFLPGEKIEGTVSLWNYENFWVSDLVFYFQILGGEKDGVATQMIDNQRDTTIFSLSPGEKTTRSFSYTLPQNLPKGNYKFRIQLANARGEELSWIEKIISIGGENKFLLLDNYWIVKDNQILSPGGGVDYQPGETPQVRFDVTNVSNFTISAFPKIITYKRNVGEEVVQETEKENLILKPGEKQTLNLSLHQLTKPETYLSEIRFYTFEDKKPISNSIYFRWIISGKEDAEILFVQADKDSYHTGEEAKIKIQYTGPAHFEMEGEEGEIKVKLINKNGNVVGEKEEKIKLKAGEIIMKVAVKENVENPKIVAEIKKGGKNYDQYEIEVKKVLEKLAEKPKEVSFFEKNKKMIFALSFATLCIILLMAILKIKSLLKILIFFALISGGILFFGNTFAATEVADSPCDTTIVFNSPPPDQKYKPGDVINFSGKFKATSCGDGLFHNKIEFFITEDKEIPTTTRNCCSDCCGATSDTYGGCIQNISNCDKVVILDESQSGYKIYKLGTIYPKDVAAGSKPYWVEYNENFVIPENLDFSGPVRFYVQYSGTHWTLHWHWNITYQKGYIYGKPSATDLKVDQSENYYCIYSKPGGIFSWKFSDPDSGDYQTAYQIQIDDNSDFSSPIFDTGKINSPSNSYATLPGDLNEYWNTKFYWRLKVWDSENLESDWILGPSFVTPKHPFPQIDFSWVPQKPALNEVVQFTDNSQVFGGATKISWFWTFQDGQPAVSTEQNPQVKFSSLGPKIVKLRMTDSDNCSCEGQKTINTQIPLPKWREISF